MKNKIIIFLFLATFCALIPLQSFAAIIGPPGPVVCASHYLVNLDNVFQDFQSSEYINGLLRVNFKLQDSPITQIISAYVGLYDSDCNSYGDDYYDPTNPPAIYFPPHTINFSLRFLSPTHFVIWNNDTNQQFDCPGCNVDFSSFGYPNNLQANFTVSGSKIYNVISSGALPILDPNYVAGKTPVLIVPGLLGTEMKEGNKLLWANIPGMFSSASDNFMDPLAFKNDLTPINSGVYKNEMIRNPYNVFDYTGGLINEFQN